MRLHELPAAAGDHPRPELVEETGAEAALLGSWSATRWHYTAQFQPTRAIDVVCDLRATITLSLTAGRYVLTWAIPGRPHGSIGGGWVTRGSEIEFTPTGTDRMEPFVYRQRPDVLSLRGETSGWDFDGDGQEEPAVFIAVFVRL